MTDSIGQSDGAWIISALTSESRKPVSVVPSGYEAYAEIIHEPDNDRTSPDALSPDALHALLAVLRVHTKTPDHSYFGRWVVWGDLDRATRIWTFDSDAARARVPARRAEFEDLHPLSNILEVQDFAYRLFAGPLEAAALIGTWLDENMFVPRAPDLIWPSDRAWCVRRNGDADTYLAGSSALVRDVVAHPDLHARLVN